jgi:predicted TIM-barrel fold metal-dependent hydrolase
MKIIDCDSHYLPESLSTLVYQVDPVIVAENTKPPFAFCDVRGMTHIDDRLNDFSQLKITKQLLCPQEWAMRFNYSVDPTLATDMCKKFNNEVKQVVDLHPSRFFAAAVLPIQNMPEAIKELHRVVSLGFKIIYVDNIYITSETNLAITEVPGIEEIFRICEQNNIVVYFHSMMHHTYPFKDLYRNIQAFLPGPIQINIYSVISSGLFDRYPALQVVFAEGADRFIPGVYNVISHVYASNRMPHAIDRHPLEYFKNNISICVDIEKQDSFRFILNNFGSERILFSTDYPHDDESGKNQFNDVNDLLALNLNQIDLENIAFKNAKRLFQLL